MPNRAYHLSLLYFLVFSLLLLISSTAIFALKIGFSFESVLQYYRGNEESFISAKSYSGLLKVILPHIFAFGLFIMVVLHFLVFTKKRDTKELKYLIFISFIGGFLELFSPFGIISGYDFFVYVKIGSFFLFQIALLYALYLLLHSIVFD